MLPVKRNHAGFKTVIVMYYFAQGGQRSVTACALSRAGRNPPVWVLIQEHRSSSCATSCKLFRLLLLTRWAFARIAVLYCCIGSVVTSWLLRPQRKTSVASKRTGLLHHVSEYHVGVSYARIVWLFKRQLKTAIFKMMIVKSAAHETRCSATKLMKYLTNQGLSLDCILQQIFPVIHIKVMINVVLFRIGFPREQLLFPLSGFAAAPR